MKENSLFFKTLSAEESCAVNGGTSTPMFVLDPTNRNQGGQILNVDGRGNSITMSGSENANGNNNNTINPLQLALPMPEVAMQNNNSK
ncbi:hypothetical protein [Anabaena subtropica]|uniref:Uncharacterized protein n=1 Tax=Anabaena subtropica FACHB-260 TaxID=2692884 RepID=A0ABR8CVH6_9NOST|nr:hypothetical protein [Anabaena subtropica]MBD2346490.1 hypothetical protein [Anabaena subtropica FACHB-260]